MKKGFTLTEVLVAVAILVILTAIVLPNFANMRERGRDTKRITDIKNLQLALERYHMKHGQYPDVHGGLIGISGDPVECVGTSEGRYLFSNSGLKDLVTEGFISSLPEDPRNKDGFCYSYRRNYGCDNRHKKNHYHIYFKPENFNTFGGTKGGEHDTKEHAPSSNLCLEP